MKQLIAALTLMFAMPAFAQQWAGGFDRVYGGEAPRGVLLAQATNNQHGFVAFRHNSVLLAQATTTTGTTTPLATPTQTDNLLSVVWTDIQSSSQFTFLDNAMTGYFYDALNKRSLVGVTSSIYLNTAIYTSLDFGVAGAKTANSSSSDINSYQGFPILAGNFHAGQLLVAKVPALATLIESMGVSQSSLANNVTAGGWGGRDFFNGVWSAGFFTGFRFGSTAASASSTTASTSQKAPN